MHIFCMKIVGQEWRSNAFESFFRVLDLCNVRKGSSVSQKLSGERNVVLCHVGELIHISSNRLNFILT